MDKNKYDDLDKLFRSRLRNVEQASNGWNIPPTSVLNDALDSVNNKRKSRKKHLGFYLLLGFLSVGLVYLTISNFRKIDDLNATIVDLQKTQQNLLTKENSQPKPSGHIEGNEIENQNIPDHQQSSHVIANVTIPSENPRNLTSHYSPNTQRIDDNMPSVGGNHIEILNKDFGFALANNYVISPQNGRFISIDKLPPLKTEFFSISYHHLSPSLVTDLPVVEKKKLERPFSIYAFMGYQLSSFKMTNMSNTSFSLTGYDDYFSGYHLGFGMNYDVSKKLNLQTRIFTSRVNNANLYKDNIRYKKNNETVGSNGNISYNTDYSVQSPMGRYSDHLTMNIGTAKIDQDEILNNNTDISQVFNIVSMSIGIGYNFYQFGDFSIGLNGGIGGNYILNMTENMDTKIFYKGLMMAEKIAVNNSFDHSNRYFLSLYGNIGLTYQFSDKLAFTLNSGVDHTLSSLRKSNGPTDQKTYLNNIRFALSIAYQF